MLLVMIDLEIRVTTQDNVKILKKDHPELLVVAYTPTLEISNMAHDSIHKTAIFDNDKGCFVKLEHYTPKA